MEDQEIKEVAQPGPVPQDLHMHTVFSHFDSAIVPEQTLDLIAQVRHARVIGIADHFECLLERGLDEYLEEVPAHGFHLGVEVSSAKWVEQAVALPFEYFVYHCKDEREQYRGAERLFETGKPVIIAHPMVMDTDLERVPAECLIEINNRYVWQNDWRGRLGPYVDRFRFVIDSDAHQPNWLNQNVARYVARQLGIQETLLFPAPAEAAVKKIEVGAGDCR